MPQSSLGFALPLLIFFSILFPAGCAGRSKSSGEIPIIRVRLAAGVDSVTIGSSHPTTFTAGRTEPRRMSFSNGPVTIGMTADGWRIGAAMLPGGEMTVSSDVDGAVSINGSQYRGQFRFVPGGGGRFDVINDVDAEAYLQGVLASELYRDWSVEAYKAQAIVARTYALYEARSEGRGRNWDVWADVRSQVYGGLKSETAKANDAVQATRGIVAAFGPVGDERIFKAYFSACCGGVGQNVRDGFNEAFIPPLSEKNVGGLCSISTKYAWPPAAIEKSELTRRVKVWAATRNHPIGRIQMLDRIDIESVNRFGRPVRFLLTDTTGQRYSLNCEETRWACNADRGQGPYLWSSFFKPVNQSAQIVFTEGHGSGHGVGMCQWCAESLARRGMPAEEIVRFSYHKAVLVKAY